MHRTSEKQSFEKVFEKLRQINKPEDEQALESKRKSKQRQQTEVLTAGKQDPRKGNTSTTKQENPNGEKAGGQATATCQEAPLKNNNEASRGWTESSLWLVNRVDCYLPRLPRPSAGRSARSSSST